MKGSIQINHPDEALVRGGGFHHEEDESFEVGSQV